MSTTKKYQITQLNSSNELDVLHPETDADIVNVEKGTGKYEGTASNVQDALEEIYGMASAAGVTGVKGNAESTYRTGNVNLTPANIGAEAAFTDGSATIASKSGDIVTIKAGVSQTNGAIGNSADSDITLGAAAIKGVSTSVTSGSDDLVTSGAVYTAIDNLPEPMVFKGSLGTGGTITDLPAASSANEGFVYKVITAGTYQGLVCKVGDAVISNGSEWVLIPSGDEPSGTVTSVGLSTTSNEGLTVTGSPITSSGTMTVNLDTAYGDKKNPYGSKTKNYVLAAPTNQNGTPSFRALDASDIPDLSGSYQPLDADLTAIAGLTGTSGLLKKTAANTWSLDTNTYITGNQNITISGDATGSGTTAITLTLANSGVSAGTYSAVTVNAKGLVTAGGQMIEVGTSGQSTPSASLAVGGIFFKEI